MRTSYRVQEYVYDMGAFHKSGIYEISRAEYKKINNAGRGRRLIILPQSDLYGEKLPERVLSFGDLENLVRNAEKRA